MGQNAVLHRLAKNQNKSWKKALLVQASCHVGLFRLPLLADYFHFRRRAVYAKIIERAKPAL